MFFFSKCCSFVTGSGKISNVSQKFKIELSILRYRSKPKEQNDISLEAITYLETALRSVDLHYSLGVINVEQ